MMVGKLEAEALKNEHWYVMDKNTRRVNGPLSVGYIHKMMSNPYVVENYEASQTGDVWEPIHQVPQLVPDYILKLVENK